MTRWTHRGCGDCQRAPRPGCCYCRCWWDAAEVGKEKNPCQIVSFQLWGNSQLERWVIRSLQSVSTDEILNTQLGEPQPQLMPCIFNPRNMCRHAVGWCTLPGRRCSASTAIRAVPGSRGDPGASPGCRAAAAAVCPRGHIICLFDLPLTFAVTAGKADPIDFTWIMIFCRLP